MTCETLKMEWTLVAAPLTFPFRLLLLRDLQSEPGKKFVGIGERWSNGQNNGNGRASTLTWDNISRFCPLTTFNYRPTLKLDFYRRSADSRF